MVSFSRKAHRAWAVLRFRHLGARSEGADRQFLGQIAGCDTQGLRRPIMVQSHRRSGTHFLIDTLRARFDVANDWFHLEEDFYARLSQAPVVLKSHERSYGERIRTPDGWHSYLHWVAASACYAHAHQLYILRNPRDVLRSQYYFDMKGHEGTYRIAPDTPFPAYLRSASLRDPAGMLNQTGFWCAHVAAWLNQPDVHVVRYEELLADPAPVLEQVSSVLGMPVQPARWTVSSAIGRQTTARFSKVAEAAWGPEEEALLLAEARRFKLPDLGYGLGN